LLIRVGIFGLLAVELLLVFDVLVSLVDINMSGRKSLNSNNRNRIKYQVTIDDYNIKNETNWRVGAASNRVFPENEPLKDPRGKHSHAG